MVVISVRVPDRVKIVMPAAEAGKNVFIEWKPGKGAQETMKIAEAIKSKAVKCLVGSQGKQSATLRKMKEFVSSDRIGRVFSTSAIITAGYEEAKKKWGLVTASFNAYANDIEGGASPLEIGTGHFLVAFTEVFGDVVDVTANGTVRFSASVIFGADGKPRKPTGETTKDTTHDQISLSGITTGRPESEGAFVNVHSRAGLKHSEESGKGRSNSLWIIDGEDGSIEVQPREEDSSFAFSLGFREMKILLNGVEVPLHEVGEV